MKYISRIAAMLLLLVVKLAPGQEQKLHPQIDLRLMTTSWSSITQSESFKAELIESARIQITIPRLTFSGDPTSLYYLDKLLEECGMVVVTIELPNIDDTVPVFACLQDLGPVQLSTVIWIGNIGLSQEAVLSNVKYRTEKLVTFDLDLFNDTRRTFPKQARAYGLLEVELCATDIAVLNVANR